MCVATGAKKRQLLHLRSELAALGAHLCPLAAYPFSLLLDSSLPVVMVSLSSLAILLAFSALYEHVTLVVSAQGLIFAPLETPGCAATPAMVQAGHTAVTDPACLAAEDEPGCNLFGIQDCRACALMPGYVEADVPPCDALEVVGYPAEFGDWQSVVGFSTESSDADQYVPTVIDLLTDPSSATTSSSRAGSADNSDDSNDGDDAVLDEQDKFDVTSRLRG